MPVIRSTSIETTFGASHQLVDHPVCGRPHGHQYRVRVTWLGDPDAKTGLVPSEMQIELAIKICRELANRDLNQMIPAAPMSAGGVAGYLLERLTMHRVTKVEVHESDTNITGVAERVPG